MRILSRKTAKQTCGRSRSLSVEPELCLNISWSRSCWLI